MCSLKLDGVCNIKRKTYVEPSVCIVNDAVTFQGRLLGRTIPLYISYKTIRFADQCNSYRFNTRVDYVFQHQSVSTTWKCVRVDHLETDASDHNAVNVTFRRVL